MFGDKLWVAGEVKRKGRPKEYDRVLLRYDETS